VSGEKVFPLFLVNKLDASWTIQELNTEKERENAIRNLTVDGTILVTANAGKLSQSSCFGMNGLPTSLLMCC
jgi:hypothetical protein